jgi:hypothetical protein
MLESTLPDLIIAIIVKTSLNIPFLGERTGTRQRSGKTNKKNTVAVVEMSALA